MAKNDKILIDGIIDDRIEQKLPSDKRDEVFEYFAFEQLLKDYDLSNEELISGSVDGRNDGGIDGFYIFINGHLLLDLDKFNWPKTGSVLELWIITCKHHDTFKQAPLDNLVASLSELFDLSIENNELKGDYSSQILTQRDIFKKAYRKVSPRLSEFNIFFSYASRGNFDEIGESIISRSNQIKQIAKDSFTNCNSEFSFIGSSELIELNRKAPIFTLELPFSDNLSSGETYILLTKLNDYYRFISDDTKLRRYLFDSNVRDFMGMNRVNEDIRETLLNENSPDFWWLNNGVTILATGASLIGKSIQIKDIQIVNGLQTSESIYRYFSNGGIDTNNRSVLVKVIVSNNSENRDDIIRATNNQTFVELSALHATDKIQRDIEEVLRLNDMYYERRTNYYKNQGISIEEILTPLYLASGYVNLILKSPQQANNLKSKFMRDEYKYNKVFSESIDLKVWPKIAYILKKTDRFLESIRPNQKSITEYFNKHRRQYLSFLTVSLILKDFGFSADALVKFDESSFTKSALEKSWLMLTELFSDQNYKYRIKLEDFILLCEQLSVKENILGFEKLKYSKGLIPPFAKIHNKKEPVIPVKSKEFIDEEFIAQVNTSLPAQPWKPGVHKEITKLLNCTNKDYFAAVETLISRGMRYTQKNGITYDIEGNIVSIDDERVNLETLELK
jgi:hypothetical protein